MVRPDDCEERCLNLVDANFNINPGQRVHNSAHNSNFNAGREWGTVMADSFAKDVRHTLGRHLGRHSFSAKIMLYTD